MDNLDPTSHPGHFWKYLALGPDGKLYFNIGSPGNIVMPSYMQATVNRVDPNTGVIERVAQGVRNSVGFDWHPKTKELYFTNHARDWIDDDNPNDTLHRVTRCISRQIFPVRRLRQRPTPCGSTIPVAIPMITSRISATDKAMRLVNALTVRLLPASSLSM